MLMRPASPTDDRYDSLAELFLEYKRSYERVFHTLRRVKVLIACS